MRRAIDETERGREKQQAYNREHGITPRGIEKAVNDVMEGAIAKEHGGAREFARVAEEVARYGRLSPEQLSREIGKLERQMYEHARNLEFEEAARLRDEIRRMEERNLGMTG
jgi:excinuclease ABC subunit B